MDFVTYMRAHGNTPGRLQRPLLAGAISGLVAAAPALYTSWHTGVTAASAQHLDFCPLVITAIDGAWLTVMAMVFARVFGRALNDPRSSWLFGISYGFFLWSAGPIVLLEWIFGLVLRGEAAAGAFVSFLIYGLVLGVIYPFVHAPFMRRAWSQSHGPN
jgi:hypothetical protein